jgi:hypothetical protein
MDEALSGTEGKHKKDAAADVINRFLEELVMRSAWVEKGEQVVKHHWDVGVVGYGGRGVGPAFTGVLSKRDLVPLPEIADNPARIETRTKKFDDGAGGLVEVENKFSVWFDPVAEGSTPMCRALRYAHQVLADWVQRHYSSFPPIVVNICGSEASDGDCIEPARELTGLTTADGNVLLLNCLISSIQSPPLLFPESDRDCPDKLARLLFEISSPLPYQPFGFDGKARGFSLNSHLSFLAPNFWIQS